MRATVTTIEYDDQGAAKSTKTVTVTSVERTGDEVSAVLRSRKVEKNGTVSEDRDQHYLCSPDGVRWGLGVEDASTEQEAYLMFPNEMPQGLVLPPNLKLEYSGQDALGKKGTVAVETRDRTVNGVEKISVAAGTWNCTRLTYDFKITLKLGLLRIPFKANVTEWYHPEVGVVRSEVRSKDKLLSYSAVTSVAK